VINVATSTPTTFDLSIKKFVNGNDAQNSSSLVSIATSTGFIYTLVVRNE
jgi:hypothetical protein